MKFGNLSVSLDYASVENQSTFSPSIVKLNRILNRVSANINNKAQQFDGYMHSFSSMIRERRASREGMESTGESFRNRKINMGLIKKHLKSIAIAGAIVFVIIVLGKALFKTGKSSNAESPEIKPAKATMQINKEFAFPLNASTGDKVADVKFMLENAELRDDIIVSGRRATSIKGREFLILTVKISNEYKSAIQIDTRDYVRLSVNGNDEWLAPDIHNDPVEVQAISTKYTRLGFAINETDKDLLVRIGEINGAKETISLEFK